MENKIQVYAILRIDAGQPGLDAITIKEILPTLEEAESEVRRLNELNREKGASYALQATRYYPEGRGKK